MSDLELESGSDEDEGFFFESDHLALRGNTDYMKVLQTIAILEAQRCQATKDIDKFVKLQRDALNDPDGFVKNLQQGGSIDSPAAISIVEIPQVNISKYGVDVPAQAEGNDRKDTESREGPKSSGKNLPNLWTFEEQKRLEELLVEYPTERIEMQRFAKIAEALGTRTTKQVASRCQKFFKKLHAARLPVPGRLPKVTKYGMSKFSKNLKAQRPSTFFPEFNVPMRIAEDDSLLKNSYDLNFLVHPSNSSSACVTRSNSNAEESAAVIVSPVDSVLTTGSELKACIRSLLIRVKKVKKQSTEYSHFHHEGFSCNKCQETPIRGIRWHCLTCDQSSIDFCSDCLVSICIENEFKREHSMVHSFVGYGVGKATEGRLTKFQRDLNETEFESDEDAISDESQNPSTSASFSCDPDYSTTTNYLDPNFTVTSK